MKRKCEGVLKQGSMMPKPFNAFSSIDALFNDSFSNPLLKNADPFKLFTPLQEAPTFIGNNAPHHKIAGLYTIYSMNTLSDLIKASRLVHNEATVSLRFLLTPQFELLFAMEGLVNAHIPPHFAMTGLKKEDAQCITAGVITINLDNKIEFISHQSGCFRPSWDSLQYGLLALFACGAQFADDIHIENVRTFSGFCINREQMKKYLSHTFTETQMANCRAINNKLRTAIHEYKSPQKNLFFKDDSLLLEKKDGQVLTTFSDEKCQSIV